MARWQDQADFTPCAFLLIDLQQSFAQSVDGYANDGVGMGVKFRPPAQRLDRDRVLLDLVGPALEVLLADVAQHPRQIARTTEHAGGQKPFALLPFRLQLQRNKIDVLGRYQSAHDGPF